MGCSYRSVDQPEGAVMVSEPKVLELQSQMMSRRSPEAIDAGRLTASLVPPVITVVAVAETLGKAISQLAWKRPSSYSGASSRYSWGHPPCSVERDDECADGEGRGSVTAVYRLAALQSSPANLVAREAVLVAREVSDASPARPCRRA